MTITLDLSPYVQWNEDQFFEFCQRHSDLRIERSAQGEVVIMPPVGGESGNRNFCLTGLLGAWVGQHRELGVGFDSSTGFLLPNGAQRSPDAAWVSRERWDRLTPEQRRKFPPLCPDFVVELLSPSDSFTETQAKLREYIANGARLGWLVDADRQRAEIYRADGSVESVTELSGEDVLPGLLVKLSDLT